MKVTPEQYDQYAGFVQQQAEKLNCVERKYAEDKILWHYTSGEALMNILQTGSIYATQVSCLNDTTEFQYSSHLYRDALLEVQKKGSHGAREDKLIEEILRDLIDSPEFPRTASGRWFVACFSEEEDDLSQWRAYTTAGNAYAIGFHANSLLGFGDILGRVNYDEAAHKKAAAETADQTIRFFREGLAAHQGIADEDPEEWTQDFLNKWDFWISKLAPLIKNNAFKHEREFRIIHELDTAEMGEIKFIQKKTLMSRHLPLVFPRIKATRAHSKFLPIQRLMVGPGPHKQITRVSVNTLLMNSGLSHVQADLSKVPFQAL